MRYYGGLFWSYLAQYAKTRLEYRWDFVAGLFTDLIYQSTAIIFLLVVFQQTPVLGGWRQEEVFFIYGYFLIPYALFGTLSSRIWSFSDQYIVRGELDRILLRPANALFQLILEGIELESLLATLTGAAIMVWAAARLDLQWQWHDPFAMVILIIGSTLVYFGIYLPLAAIAFWYDGRTGIMPLLWNVNNYGRYPVSIYNQVMRTLLTWVAPFAFVGFYPAAYFLRRGAFQTWALLTPAIGLAFCAVAYQIWKAGLRRYHGTGS